MIYQTRPASPLGSTRLGRYLIAIAVAVAYGIAGHFDYTDARVEECWADGQRRYDAKNDTCLEPRHAAPTEN